MHLPLSSSPPPSSLLLPPPAPRLQLAHQLTVPYENLDVFLGRRKVGLAVHLLIQPSIHIHLSASPSIHPFPPIHPPKRLSACLHPSPTPQVLEVHGLYKQVVGEGRGGCPSTSTCTSPNTIHTTTCTSTHTSSCTCTSACTCRWLVLRAERPLLLAAEGTRLHCQVGASKCTKRKHLSHWTFLVGIHCMQNM